MDDYSGEIINRLQDLLDISLASEAMRMLGKAFAHIGKTINATAEESALAAALAARRAVMEEEYEAQQRAAVPVSGADAGAALLNFLDMLSIPYVDIDDFGTIVLGGLNIPGDLMLYRRSKLHSRKASNIRIPARRREIHVAVWRRFTTAATGG